MSSLPTSLADLRVRTIQRRLLAWGRQNYRRYEWREESDPWLNLVAQFLLQRTRARQAESAFVEFKSKYPTAEALVTAGPEAARGALDNLGLYWRSSLLYKLAQTVAERGGVPPESGDELARMMGVGPYTAAAWLSLHRGKRAVIIDANVSRFLSRLTGRKRPVDARHCGWLRNTADRLTPRRAFRDYNYAVLDFTMSVCTGVRPNCRECPLLRCCEYGRCQAP